MTDEQKNLFRLLYNFIHDEKIQCGNLSAMIEVEFPDRDQDEVSRALYDFIKVYLRERQVTGAVAMELMYLLDEVVKGEGSCQKTEVRDDGNDHDEH